MWSIGLQREIFKNLVIEATYVGNRGAWWQANGLIDINALTPQRIASFGLDINNAADRSLLTSQLNSALAAQRGFNKPPYANFPTSSTVAQSLRPFPQFTTITYMWAPLGRTWYDSMQIKATKRFSHGLDFTSTFTWQKELMMGAESETAGMAIMGSATQISSAVNNVFDRKTNKYISGLSRPIASSTAVNYTLPKWGSNRVLSYVVRDWRVGAVLQYASGLPILAPVAQNQLASVLFRSTYANRVPGVPLFTKDLNCHCIDPTKDFVLNPSAWVDPPAGQYGTGAAYYSDYRYERRPSEALSLGRLFRIKEGVILSIRAEFANAFNRTYMNNPTSTNAKATQTFSPSTGLATSGFGWINTGSVASQPRNGTIVARITF
jgi:hypothetical protein